MNIQKVTHNKKAYLDLLLLADEQENMVDKYLERGEMFVLNDNGVKAECVITKEADGVYELKNIAVAPAFQRRGVGRALIDAALARLPAGTRVLVGAGETPASFAFYSACGFTLSHRVKNFFTDNYPQPIWDDGVLLTDMVYFVRLF